MAILEILKFPDPRLRKKSMPVTNIKGQFDQYCEDMLETMRSFSGIGLAAPQVNRLIRLLVVDTSAQPESEGSEQKNERYKKKPLTDLEQAIEQPFFIFNPVILKKTGKVLFEEGCLSVPNYFETVQRFSYIEVEGLDKNEKKISIKTDGLLSICIQHEIDHLDGKLFIDMLSPIKSNKIKNKIKKFGYPTDDKKNSETNSL